MHFEINCTVPGSRHTMYERYGFVQLIPARVQAVTWGICLYVKWASDYYRGTMLIRSCYMLPYHLRYIRRVPTSHPTYSYAISHALSYALSGTDTSLRCSARL